MIKDLDLRKRVLELLDRLGAENPVDSALSLR